MTDPIPVRYSDAFGEIEVVLENLNRPGNYFCFGRKEVIPLVITVEGAGRISSADFAISGA